MELERLMVDYFRANEQQPEIDHNFKGENVNKGQAFPVENGVQVKEVIFLLR